MKSFYDPGAADALKARLLTLRPDSARQWGKMNPSQAMAHCAHGMELITGERRPPRMLIGRLLGGFIKSKALGDDAPMRRNSPTVPGMVIDDARDLDTERDRLIGLMDRVTAAGPRGCTTHPHSFFGAMTPDEWGVLMYKHLDHHLRQFGA